MSPRVVTALSHKSHTAFTHSKAIRDNRRVGVEACRKTKPGCFSRSNTAKTICLKCFPSTDRD
jgi:hypothetical protein